jgi:uncharacterized RDD family membrane protein YckC
MTEPTDVPPSNEPPPAAADPYGAPPPPAYGSPPPPGQVPYGQAPYTQAPPPGQYYAAQPPVVPPGMWFDPMSGLVLPNGVQLASHGRRIGAWFLSIVLVLVTLVIGYIIWGLIIWSKGQTPALQVLGMKCWRTEDRQVPGWGWMALREVVGRIAEGILSLISALVSFVLFLASAKRQSLHDLIAGTVVLHDPDKVLG